MNKRETIIKNCFNSWINKDRATFENSFAPEVIYIESWGPAYGNLAECLAWFDDWNKASSVITWDIKAFSHDGNTCFCEWFFECEVNGVRESFDGVSIIKFSKDNKIIYLKEYQSKNPNYYPYKK